MSTQPSAIVRVAPRLRIDLRALLSYVLIGLVALVPRVLALGLFITDDEANFWLNRSDLFLKALQSGDFAATAITAHPGVTTMWLGAAGIVLRRALLGLGVLHSDAFPNVLALMRLPVVLAHVAVLLLGYALLRRMLPATVAALAALLWAADPFVIGYSKLLHTDALAGSFMTLSVLAACYYWNHCRQMAWLLLSAVAAGLAFLSKSPALVLLPAIALIALLAPTTDDRRPTADRFWSVVGGRWLVVVSLLVWFVAAAATVFALWPALWVSPLRAYEQLRVGVAIEGAQPHMLGNFFLGRQDDAPGLLYYPVALALRTTPLTLLGLLLLPLAWRIDWSKLEWRHSSTLKRDLAGLASFVILFVAAMSLFPKKFDRYMVPAFPALDFLAAVGLVALSDWRLAIGRWFRPGLPIAAGQTPIARRLATVIGIAAIANAAWWHPYSIVAFNQIFGGTRAGAQTFTVGWGEGLEQVADWLNQQPDITSVRTVALRITSLNPYLREGAQADFPKGDQLRDHTGYVVVYLPQVQPGQVDGAFKEFYGRRTPLHTVRIHGVDFAWIYQAPPQVAQPRVANFGTDIQLRGFDQGGAARRGQELRFRLLWEASAPPPKDYWLFAHLIGPDGQRYAQIDQPYRTSQWAPGRFATTELPIALPQTAPAGTYQLLIGLYNQENGQRLAVAAPDSHSLVASEAGAYMLTEFNLK
jgi:4-amino-4-deoxy-L-arabinose transferase-like glycosyltransferase